MSRVLLAVDGPSLLHRSYHAMKGTGLRTRDGRPTWAIRGFCSQLAGALQRVQPDALVIGFDDPDRNARKEVHPHYKANRPPRDEDLTVQLQMAVRLLRDAGVPTVVPAGLEADDVLASAAATARAAGWRCILLTSDRDSFALIRDDVHVLRLLTGGIDNSPRLDPPRLQTLVGVRAEQYADYAALRGDPSDNIPRVASCGEKTAVKLLTLFGTATEVFADATYGRLIKGTKGLGPALAGRLAQPEARAQFDANAALMAMSETVDLGLDLSRPGLPLAPVRVDTALASLELASVRNTMLQALCDGWLPSAAPAPVEDPPAAAHRFPAAPPEPPGPGARSEQQRAIDAWHRVFPPPVPHSTVTSGLVDPYHCMTCKADVVPHRDSVERGAPTVCQKCCAAEHAARTSTTTAGSRR